MNQMSNEVRDQLSFQASLIWLGLRLEASVSPTAAIDEKVAVEVEKLASRL